MARGIDVSHWQGAIDWPRVARDDVEWAVAKATQSVVDRRWTANRAGARAAGIPVGGYHFATPGRGGDAVAQARLHLRHATPAPGDLVPVLDLEDTDLSPRATTAWALAWCATVEAAIGARPVIYTGPGFATSSLHPDPALAAYPLWVAHYTTAARPRVPRPWTTWMWWQHTDSGRVDGIAGDVDLNRRADPAHLPLYRPDTTPDDPEELDMDAVQAITDHIDARHADTKRDLWIIADQLSKVGKVTQADYAAQLVAIHEARLAHAGAGGRSLEAVDPADPAEIRFRTDLAALAAANPPTG